MLCSRRNEGQGGASSNQFLDDLVLNAKKRYTACVALEHKKNANDQQENLCETVCLFSALNSHHAAKSSIKKGEKYDE